MNRFEWSTILFSTGLAFSAQAASPDRSAALPATVTAAAVARTACPTILDARHPRLQDEARLARASGSEPQWNFHKYLIGRDGRFVMAWPSVVKPDDARLAVEIEKALASARR